MGEKKYITKATTKDASGVFIVFYDPGSITCNSITFIFTVGAAPVL